MFHPLLADFRAFMDLNIPCKVPSLGIRLGRKETSVFFLPYCNKAGDEGTRVNSYHMKEFGVSNLKYRTRQWQATPVLLPRKSHGWRSLVGCIPWGRYESVATEQLHFHFHAMEKEMATHSSVLAWRIPGTAEPGGLPSMGSHRVGHN